MIINTRDFGKMNIDEKEIISFVCPILGFDEYTKYVMLFDEELGDSIAWLQSVEDSGICFILANTKLLDCSYSPTIPDEIVNAIGEKLDEIWLVAVITDSIENSTVNLKSPIVVNSDKQLAAQIVLEDKLPIKYTLFSRKENR